MRQEIPGRSGEKGSLHIPVHGKDVCQTHKKRKRVISFIIDQIQTSWRRWVSQEMNHTPTQYVGAKRAPCRSSLLQVDRSPSTKGPFGSKDPGGL